jgi:type II secretory pathway pseudopilin PulG
MPAVTRARGESGETLAELIVTIGIVGIAVAAIVAALATGISASSTHRQRASADTVARSVAEAIKDRKVALDPNGSYPPATWTGGVNPPIVDTSGFNVVVAATCLKGADVNATNVASANFVPCNASTTGLQTITVTVTSTGGKAEQESVTVLKRRT